MRSPWEGHRRNLSPELEKEEGHRRSASDIAQLRHDLRRAHRCDHRGGGRSVGYRRSWPELLAVVVVGVELRRIIGGVWSGGSERGWRRWKEGAELFPRLYIGLGFGLVFIFPIFLILRINF